MLTLIVTSEEVIAANTFKFYIIPAGGALSDDDMQPTNSIMPAASKHYQNKPLGHCFYIFLKKIALLIMLSSLPVSSYGAQINLYVGLPSFPPFAYPPTDNEQHGTLVALYAILEEELQKELDVKLNIQHYPYARTLVGLQDGSLDLAIIFKNLSLQGDVIYVAKVSQSKVMVIYDHEHPIQKYEDLYQLFDIAVIRQAQYEIRFDMDEKINRYPVENYKQGIQMLKLGRVAAVVGSQSGLQHILDSLEFKGEKWRSPYVLGHKEWWLHFSNKSAYQHLVPAIKKAVEKIYKEDLVYELYEQSLK